jgi:chromate transporter
VAEDAGNPQTAGDRMSRPASAPPAMPGLERISLARLLAIFFKIGSIGFGGGMAVIALMEREFVQKRKLIAGEEFLHGVGLGQILGSFAVNASFFIGYRLFGPLGGILSASAFLMPSLALVTALSHLYFRYHSIPALQGAVTGLGPVVIALILAAAWSLGGKLLQSPTAVCIAAAALAAGALKINAVWVILVAGTAGLLLPSTRRAYPGASVGPSNRTLAAVAIPAAIGPLSTLGSITMTFLKMGFVFFGGGFVLVPVLHQRLVTELGWMNTREFLDGVAISNLTPGPIAVLATFAGYHVAGVAGALVATAALLAPAMGLMWLISGQYARYRSDPHAQRFLAGVNPAVTGLILSAAVLLGGSAIGSWRGWILCGISLLLLQRFRWHPAFVLAIGSVAGYAGVLP